MAKSRELRVQIVGDDRDLKRALRSSDRNLKTLHGTARATGSGIARSLGRHGLQAAIVGVGAVAFEAKRSVDAFRESQKVARQTQAVLKSTGSAAHISAKGVQTLALALSRKTGIDDEVIQSGENMLLTFRNIRNEAGKGNDIFSQTTKAAVDMSAAFKASGKEMSVATASLQLGKALNDPIKGMSRLTRIGVTFTDKQKEQVKALENSGHHIQAQKVILGELRKEFGGSAAATATWASKLKVEFGNVEESIGRGLNPAVEAVSKQLTLMARDALPHIEKVSQGIEKIFGRKDLALGDKFQLSARTVNHGIVKPIRDELGKMHLGPKLSHAMDKAIPAVMGAAGRSGGKAVVAFAKGWAHAPLAGKLVTAGFLFGKMGGFSKVGGAAGGAFARALRRRLSNTGTNVAGDVAGDLVSGTVSGTNKRAGRLRRGLGRIFRRIGPAVGTAAASEAAGNIVGDTVTGTSRRSGRLKRGLGRIFRRIGPAVGTAAASEAAGSIVGGSISGTSRRSGRLKKGLGAIFRRMGGPVGAVLGAAIAAEASQVIGDRLERWMNSWKGPKDTHGHRPLNTKQDDLGEKGRGVIKGAFHAIFGGAEGGMVTPRGIVRGFASGGMVRDPRDTVPAMLRTGEGVLTPDAVQRIGGPKAVIRLNRGGAPLDLAAPMDAERKRLDKVLVQVRKNLATVPKEGVKQSALTARGVNTHLAAGGKSWAASTRKAKDQVVGQFEKMRTGAGKEARTLRSGVGNHMEAMRGAAGREARRMSSGVVNYMEGMRSGGGREARRLRTGVGSHFEAMRGTVQTKMRKVADHTRNGIEAARGSASRGGRRIRDAVAGSYASMDRAVFKGIGYVSSATSKALSGLGGKGVRFDVPKPKGLARGGRNFFSGGFLPGAGRQDTVPVMAAPGEAAFVTRHQQEPVEQALAVTKMLGLGKFGSLDEVFAKVAKPHFMARGGKVKGYARGGMVHVPGDPRGTGNRDRVNSSIAGQVGQWVKRYHADVGYGYDPGGGHKSPGHNVTGTATDVYPGPGGSWNLLEKGLRVLVSRGLKVLYGSNGIGTPWPGHGRGNHAHIEWGMHPGGAFGASGVPKIKVRGHGPLARIAQAAINKVRGAANRKIDSSLGAHGDLSGFTGGGSNRANMILARKMMLRMWPASEWPALKRLWMSESGFDPTIHYGGGHGYVPGLAYGIPQSKPGEKMASEGRDWKTNPVTQIRWGLKYIRGKYGRPSRVPLGGYARGGFVGGFAPGGIVARKKVKKVDRHPTRTRVRGEIGSGIRAVQTAGLTKGYGDDRTAYKQLIRARKDQVGYWTGRRAHWRKLALHGPAKDRPQALKNFHAADKNVRSASRELSEARTAYVALPGAPFPASTMTQGDRIHADFISAGQAVTIADADGSTTDQDSLKAAGNLVMVDQARVNYWRGRVAHWRHRMNNRKLPAAARKTARTNYNNAVTQLGEVSGDLASATSDLQGRVPEAADTADTSAADLATAIKELKDSVDAQNKQLRTIQGTAANTAIKALADHMSGQLGYATTQRARTPNAGVLARY